MAKTWIKCREKNIDVHEKYCSHCYQRMTVSFRKINNLPDTFRECRAMMEKRAEQKTK